MRAFIGTLLRESSQQFYHQLTGVLVAEHGDALRSVPDGSVHLTYIFIAALDDSQRDAVLSAIVHVAARHRPIDIGFNGPTVLMAGRTPRLVCANVGIGAEEVRRLASDLAEAIRGVLPALDISPMKSPHITLARFRRSASRSAAKAVSAAMAEPRLARASVREHIESIQLIESTLTQSGSIYTVVDSRPLQ
jgi:2'-5' RNA ligase